MLDDSSIAVVLSALRPERVALLDTLGFFGAEEWTCSTECPAYTVKGVATHLLGDDLSLLSRQRDRAVSGLLQVATELPGADFRTVLDTFNDRWVGAAGFLSTDLVMELLRLTGEWTACYYEKVDPAAAGEPVGFFGVRRGSSPLWHAIAREYVERWVHHSQIRRAVGLASLADEQFLRVGVEVVAAAAGMEAGIPVEPNGSWTIGAVELGPGQQAADILTRAHTAEDVRVLTRGQADAVERVVRLVGRP